MVGEVYEVEVDVGEYKAEVVVVVEDKWELEHMNPSLIRIQNGSEYKHQEE